MKSDVRIQPRVTNVSGQYNWLSHMIQAHRPAGLTATRNRIGSADKSPTPDGSAPPSPPAWSPWDPSRESVRVAHVVDPRE